MHPATMPMSGDQSRHAGGPRNTSAPTTARVTKAVAGAAASEASSGTSFNVSKTNRHDRGRD